MSVFPAAPHDHTACFAGTMKSALALAEAQGLTLTPLRRRVLEIVLASHRPMGAYDVLAELGRSYASTPAPPTVYRALDFLLRHGFVHRIESLNAYVACFAPARRHATHFLLCRGCGRAAEIEAPTLCAALDQASKAAGFRTEREMVEIAGLCSDCAAAADRAADSSSIPSVSTC
jgi:Fur family transcriptional regulator, zinc uptake regulator